MFLVFLLLRRSTDPLQKFSKWWLKCWETPGLKSTIINYKRRRVSEDQWRLGNLYREGILIFRLQNKPRGPRPAPTPLTTLTKYVYATVTIKKQLLNIIYLFIKTNSVVSIILRIYLNLFGLNGRLSAVYDLLTTCFFSDWPSLKIKYSIDLLNNYVKKKKTDNDMNIKNY